MRRHGAALLSLTFILGGLGVAPTSASAADEQPTRYYFHSESSIGTVDDISGRTPTFDLVAPTKPGQPSTAPHVIAGSGGPTFTDITFQGTVDAAFGAITFDLFFVNDGWAEEELKALPFAFYMVHESQFHQLRSAGPWQRIPTGDPTIEHIRFTTSSYLSGTSWLPLVVDAGDEIALRIDAFLPVTLLYDASDFPSGFETRPRGEPAISPPLPRTTYHLHPGESDGPLDASGILSTDPPTGETKIALDVPGVLNQVPEEPYDPTWSGWIDGTIESLRLSLWHNSSDGNLTETTTYQVAVWLGDGATAPKQFPFRTVASRADIPGHLEVDIPNVDIDASGAQLTIAIRDTDPVPDASAFFYGSADYPSAITVNPEIENQSPTCRTDPSGDGAAGDGTGGGASRSGVREPDVRASSPRGPASGRADAPLAGFEANVREVSRFVEVSEASYPVAGPDGAARGNARWRVVAGTGNCCETYVTATSTGRIVDLGGWAPMFSDDMGQTWSVVENTIANPICVGSLHCRWVRGGEGAVAEAPNGDIVALSWDLFGGDTLITFKYDAAADRWFFMHQQLKSPLFDRPWVAVIDGPFTIGSQTVPYISVITSGGPAYDVWYYSVDGLNYVLADTHSRTGPVGPPVTAPLPMTTDADTDWIQPNVWGGWTPLPGGGALGKRGQNLFGIGDGLSYLPPGSLVWRDVEMPGYLGGGLLADSRGWLHEVVALFGRCYLRYRISTDGGSSWTSEDFLLPAGHTVERYDFRVNGALGMAAIVVHGHERASATDQDFVFEIDVSDPTPRLRYLFDVGEGGLNFTVGLNVFADNPRFDFPSIAILPDGSIVTSFGDHNREFPVLAILLQRPATPTTLTIVGDEALNGTFSDRTEIEARLTDARGRPIDDADLSFRLTGVGGEASGTVATSEGSARWNPKLEIPPGSYQLTVAFAGNEANAPIVETSAFTIGRETTVSTLDAVGRGAAMDLIGVLTDDEGEPIAGQTITFKADGTIIGTAQTLADGRASLEVPPRYRSGRSTFESDFAATDLYLGSGARIPS